MKIFNLIVTYNRSEKLKTTFENLKKNGYQNLIVVNNNSTDDTEHVLRKYYHDFENFFSINLSENTGCSGGVNAAFKTFLTVSSSTDYAIVHDDDSWPNFDCKCLIQFFERNDIKHGCFPVLTLNGELNLMNIPGSLKFLKTPFSYKSLKKSHRQRRPRNLNDFNFINAFDYSSFVGYVIRHLHVSQIGLPSPKFFIYSDDTTYTFVASKKIGKLSNLYNGDMCFLHDCNRSTGKKLLHGRFANYEIRNKVIFLRIASGKFAILFILYYFFKCVLLMPNRPLIIFNNVLQGLFADLSKYLPINAK